MDKKIIAISGINLHEGGPLTVYKDLLNSIIDSGVNQEYKIIAFVHSTTLFSEYRGKVSIVELPESRRNYVIRLYYEWIYFKRFSKKNNVKVWISLHDITPNVKSEKLYTYCHNPSPFYKPSKLDWKFSRTMVAFSLFYKLLYRININRNTAVIVQQEWIRREFKRIFHIENCIVAKPKNESSNRQLLPDKKSNQHQNKKLTFIYASYPRTFKNFEVICEACALLELESIKDYCVQLTIDGSENPYSHYIRKRYYQVNAIEWIGIQPREKLFEYYYASDCMIFPSRLETWGLPISEFKETGKPIILSNLPYAHETVGNYDKTAFFNPLNPSELAEIMKKAIEHKQYYTAHNIERPEPPYADNWSELLDIILNKNEGKRR